MPAPNPRHNQFTVNAATTANINLSVAPSAIDGVPVQSNFKLLVKDQDDPIENGVYFLRRGRFFRPLDKELVLISGSILVVQSGIENGERLYVLVTENPLIIGETPLEFLEYVEDIAQGARGLQGDPGPTGPPIS